MTPLTVGSLFSGIGGFELGLERTGGYPKLFKMSQEGYLNSAIGRAFGVSGTTAGKLIRKYQAEAGL